MVQFVCSKCGKCCKNFGQYIVIDSIINNATFYCTSKLSKEKFVAQVDKDQFRNFKNGREQSKKSNWCPFLRLDDVKPEYICTIYSTRPQICKDFKCSVMDIFDKNRKIIGRTSSNGSLVSQDTTLNNLWKEHIAPFMQSKDQKWLSRIKTILEEKGFQVLCYE